MAANVEEVLERLAIFRSDLELVASETAISRDHGRGWERLKRWKLKCADWLAKTVSPDEAQKLTETSGTIVLGAAMETFQREFRALHAFIDTLYQEIRTDPEFWLGRGAVPSAADATPDKSDSTTISVFIGHGRNPAWARVQQFLEHDFGLNVITFESETRAGQHIVQVLESMLNQAGFAILVLTGEDLTPEGGMRARQNVIHEAGLFQGRLGFSKAILLVQSGLEEFSNVAGLQQIHFTEAEIQQTFYELGRVLKREGIVK